VRLLLVSDLHTEFARNPLDFVSKAVPSTWTPENLDFLALVGDIVVPSRQSPEQVKQVFEYLGQRARHVLYLEGNHEYYGCEAASSVEARLVESFPDNFVWLFNDERTIEGKHFYGGTMWFNNDDQMNFYFKRSMNDFHQIGGFEQWVYKRNQMFTGLGLSFVRPETVVLTHHLPHSNSTPGEYRGSNLNRFFVSDQTQLITEKQPRLWLHGHTHHPCDYTLGDTRVVCNPHGYPNEHTAGWVYPQVVLEI
jgi:Icc-related predicted phosphoesterase